MTFLQRFVADYSFLIVVLLMLGVTVALNVRDWCMRNHVPFREYPHAFFLVALVTRFYILLLVWFVAFPDIAPSVRMLTSQGLFWLFLIGLIHACRGPLEWYSRHVVMPKLRHKPQHRRALK